jgi:hypothetical protein
VKPKITRGMPMQNRVKLFELVPPDGKKINVMIDPTSKKNTPILRSMQVIINEMGETSNACFSH